MYDLQMYYRLDNGLGGGGVYVTEPGNPLSNFSNGVLKILCLGSTQRSFNMRVNKQSQHERG